MQARPFSLFTALFINSRESFHPFLLVIKKINTIFPLFVLQKSLKHLYVRRSKMNIGHFGDDSTTQPDSGAQRQEPEKQKAKFVFKDSLREVHQMASLSKDNFRKQLPFITQSIHTLFSEFQKKQERIMGGDLMALTIIQGRLKKESGIEEKVFEEIEALRQAFNKMPQDEKIEEKIANDERSQLLIVLGIIIIASCAIVSIIVISAPAAMTSTHPKSKPEPITRNPRNAALFDAATK